MDFGTPAVLPDQSCPNWTEPLFLDDAAILAEELKRFPASSLQSLMGISPDLANLTRERYKDWQAGHQFPQPGSLKQALYAYRGDVYDGLQVDAWPAAMVERAQTCLKILSGLYGLLRPLDLIRPYRLEMGIRLHNPHGNTLYRFWHETLLAEIDHCLAEQRSSQHPLATTIINLASLEYNKAIPFKELQHKHPQLAIISPVFQDVAPNGDWKTLGLFGKQARGYCARWILEQLEHAPAHHANHDFRDHLEHFNRSGYRYCASVSTRERPVFRRERHTRLA